MKILQILVRGSPAVVAKYIKLIKPRKVMIEVAEGEISRFSVPCVGQAPKITGAYDFLNATQWCL